MCTSRTSPAAGSWLEGTYSGIISVVANKGQTLKIGKYTSIGHRLEIMMSSGHRADSISTYPFRRFRKLSPDQSFVVGDISIGNDCWIGSDVMLLGGCTIGDGVVLARRAWSPQSRGLRTTGYTADHLQSCFTSGSTRRQGMR